MGWIFGEDQEREVRACSGGLLRVDCVRMYRWRVLAFFFSSAGWKEVDG
jgi:hypothetical protein